MKDFKTDSARRSTAPSAVSRRRFIEGAGNAGIMSVAFLVASPARRSGAAEPVRIGSVGQFSGLASQIGADIKRGVQLALDDARIEGDLPLVIDGQERDVEIVWIDSQSDPQRAAEAVRDAIIRQGVQFIANGWHSDVAMAISDIEAPYEIVHIGHLGETQYLSEKMRADPDKYRGYFKGHPAPPKLTGLYGPPLQHFIAAKLWQPANRKVAIMTEDTNFGLGWGQAITESLRAVGFEVYPYDVTALDETEFTPLLDKYKAQQVSLVCMGNVSAINFVRQFRQQDVKALLLAHGLTWTKGWYELTGDASDYAIAADSPHVVAPWQEEWVARYRDRFGTEPSITASGLAYDYMRMALRVLNKAGTLDFNALVEAVYDTPYDGIWNRYVFPREPNEWSLAQNDVQVGPFMEGFFFPMVQLMGGEARVIWPLEYAAAEFQAPPWLSES